MTNSLNVWRPRALVPLAIASILLGAGLMGCATSSSLALVRHNVQGTTLSPDALAQIRPGQSQELVTAVLGSPLTVNSFTEEVAWYYVETKVSQTAFGLTTAQERTVLAIYFDKRKRISDRAIYTGKDGKLSNIETRKTPSYGADTTFIQSLLNTL